VSEHDHADDGIRPEAQSILGMEEAPIESARFGKAGPGVGDSEYQGFGRVEPSYRARKTGVQDVAVERQGIDGGDETNRVRKTFRNPDVLAVVERGKEERTVAEEPVHPEIYSIHLSSLLNKCSERLIKNEYYTSAAGMSRFFFQDGKKNGQARRGSPSGLAEMI
jgi:hypothetical protein